MVITFSNADRKFVFPEKKRLKKFIAFLFEAEQKGAESLSYVFCSDDFLLDINLRFLKHNNYTDIITFDLSDSAESLTGEIYISIDRVKENAVAANVSFKNEMLRVVFHGALHLCGYNDKTKSEIAILRQMENKYLRLYEKS
jgi:probable rRNA maturation factor